MTGLVVLVILVLCLFLFAFFITGNDIMAPSVMMCVMFFISSCLALLNVENWGIDHYSGEAVLIIVSGILVFILTEVAVKGLVCRYRPQSGMKRIRAWRTSYSIAPQKLNLLLLFDVCAIAIYMRYIMRTVGSAANLGAYFLAYRHQGISNMSSGSEQSTGWALNLMLKIVGASGYAAVYLLMYKLLEKGGSLVEKMKLFGIVILSVLPSFMTAGRSGALRIISAALIEYYIVWHQKKGWNRVLSWKYMRYGVLLLLCGSVTFYYSLRLIGRTTHRPLLDYISDYLAGGIQMFNLYLQDPVKREMFGEETLYSLTKITHALGLSDVSTHYNMEFRSLGIGFNNVYTFFRRPLHDFGLVGMYLFTAFVAALFAYIYYGKIKYRDYKRAEKWTLLIGYLYYWIILSSIDQYSVTYVSYGTVSTLIIIFLIFYYLVNGKRRFKFRL